NKRGLPYPEGYQNYHQYRILKDISVENVKEGFSKLSITDKQLLMADMEEFRFSFDDLANPQKGQIAKVFGQGGGTQIKMITSISWFEKLGLLREVK
ncbi:TPA: hypothetical protein TVL48_001852, partial [Streptococcus equi subsp. zooepidemicus]|nr:hypothetical protein [Streptococcus equi subsp. zooepidemicus]